MAAMFQSPGFAEVCNGPSFPVDSDFATEVCNRDSPHLSELNFLISILRLRRSLQPESVRSVPRNSTGFNPQTSPKSATFPLPQGSILPKSFQSADFASESATRMRHSGGQAEVLRVSIRRLRCRSLQLPLSHPSMILGFLFQSADFAAEVCNLRFTGILLSMLMHVSRDRAISLRHYSKSSQSPTDRSKREACEAVQATRRDRRYEPRQSPSATRRPVLRSRRRRHRSLRSRVLPRHRPCAVRGSS
jgi:hypothetical protein